MDWVAQAFSAATAFLHLAGPAVLGVAGFVVALVALSINYRNSNGWKPLVLVKDWYLSELNDGIRATVALEIWNRRRYPIVVRKVRVRVGTIRMACLEDVHKFPDNEPWHLINSGATLEVWKDRVIASSTLESLSVAARCKEEGEFPQNVKVRVEVLVFDPKKNKHTVIERVTGSILDVPDWGR
jgi:hypothetical protein